MLDNIFVGFMCGLFCLLLTVTVYGVKQGGDYDKLNLECARAGGIGENVSTSVFDDAKIECKPDVAPLYVK